MMAKWKMADGRWQMAMENGKWKMEGWLRI
jgi:hypothetical protein